VTGWDDLTPIEVQEAARIVEEIADPEAMIVWGMTFDDSYEWEVKVSIIATWFPESVQDTMIKNVWVRSWALGRLGGASRTSSRGSTSADFVKKAMHEEGMWGSSMWQQAAPRKPERDYETPAFLRKKLLNG
jgi:cell division GTPase FtsZ